jgi:WD40 repeat protein
MAALLLVPTSNRSRCKHSSNCSSNSSSSKQQQQQQQQQQASAEGSVGLPAATVVTAGDSVRLDFGRLQRRQGPVITERPLRGEGLSRWKPSGRLIGVFSEHRAAVRTLAMSDDNLFFVSGGEDGMVKVWDCQKLQSTVSHQSRLTYASLGGRVTAVSMCGWSHTVACASTTGAVDVVRVDCALELQGTTFTGVTPLQRIVPHGGGVVVSVVHDTDVSTPHMVVYVCVPLDACVPSERLTLRVVD